MDVMELMLGHIFEEADNDENDVFVVVECGDTWISAYGIYHQELVTFWSGTSAKYLGRLDKVIDNSGI